ncbi:MAG: hypothetical protein HPY81_08455 [Firmicutes bacterium]|nr:hypothetical protein [Bacillota bacterium]
MGNASNEKLFGDAPLFLLLGWFLFFLFFLFTPKFSGLVAIIMGTVAGMKGDERGVILIKAGAGLLLVMMVVGIIWGYFM